MPVIINIDAKGTKQSFKLSRKVITLGRGDENDVILKKDGRISRKHLSLSLSSQGTVEFRDLGSSNGSFLNGDTQRTGSLKLGDELYIGDVRIWVEESKLTDKEKARIGVSRSGQGLGKYIQADIDDFQTKVMSVKDVRQRSIQLKEEGNLTSFVKLDENKKKLSEYKKEMKKKKKPPSFFDKLKSKFTSSDE
jgi:pSer/pThr/pTyr-binding forkhead associated (FHA) protein